MAAKARYTGDRCDGMPEVLVNWLVDHGQEVSFRQFAKHVDVSSFEVGPLSKCDHCSFLKTSLPSGIPAWVLQWSGFEHLAVDDPSLVDIDAEAEIAFRNDLSPRQEPVVWWDDVQAIAALGGLESMGRFETATTHDVWNPEAYRFEPEPIAWVVPEAYLTRAGVEPIIKRRQDLSDLRGKTSSVYKANPSASAESARASRKRGLAMTERGYASNPVDRPGPEAITAMERVIAAMHKNESDRASPMRSFGDWERVRIADAAQIGTNLKLPRVFRGALVHYDPSPADRKILEAASKEFSRRTVTLPWGQAARTAYAKKLRQYDQYLAALKRTLARAPRKIAAEGQGLTVLNTGGFDRQTMQASEQIVAEASRLLREKGFGAVLYGPVYVTNSLTARQLLAFYDSGTDEVYLRANIRGQMGPALATVIHELAHRYDQMVLKNDAGVHALYAETEEKTDELRRKLLGRIRAEGMESVLPKPGERIEIGGKQFIIRDIQAKSKPERVYLHRLDARGQVIAGQRSVPYLPLNTFFEVAFGQTVTAFVTDYAKKNQHENFAELVAAYCTNKLAPEDWRAEAIRKLCGIPDPQIPVAEMGVIKVREGLFRITYKDLPTIYVAEAHGAQWALRRTLSPWDDEYVPHMIGTPKNNVADCTEAVARIFTSASKRAGFVQRRPRVGA